jgi:hypothetical protein
MASIMIDVLGAQFGSIERTVYDKKNFVYTVWIRTYDGIPRQVWSECVTGTTCVTSTIPFLTLGMRETS